MSAPIRKVLDVARILDDRSSRVIVCCGSGGVGKTTTAAALALRAAERGRSVVVLTIDPARRLAQALGVASLDNSTVLRTAPDAKSLMPLPSPAPTSATVATVCTMRSLIDTPVSLP